MEGEGPAVGGAFEVGVEEEAEEFGEVFVVGGAAFVVVGAGGAALVEEPAAGGGVGAVLGAEADAPKVVGVVLVAEDAVGGAGVGAVGVAAGVRGLHGNEDDFGRVARAFCPLKRTLRTKAGPYELPKRHVGKQKDQNSPAKFLRRSATLASCSAAYSDPASATSLSAMSGQPLSELKASFHAFQCSASLWRDMY